MRIPLLLPLVLAAAALAAACSGGAPAPQPAPVPQPAAAPAAETPKESPAVHAPPVGPDARPDTNAAARTEVATFGGGCYWCIEAVFEQVPGVLDVRSGFMGGATPAPTYRDVCEGDTGHAEVVQVTFDPAKVSYDALLVWFWKSHDPTTLNRQGADVGTQYRSVIFFHTPEQRAAAERSKAEVAKLLEVPVVTEIAAASAFTEADEHHQDYYRQNRAQPYCRAVIQPKLRKLGLRE